MNTTTRNRSVIVAGWSMVVIAVLHTVAHLFHPYWSDWLSGELWTGNSPADSYAFFWALPGSFVVVLAILGGLIVRMGRRGDDVPRYVGWGLGAWVVGCLALIGPSGFVFGILPSVLLIVDGLRRRVRTSSPVERPAGQDTLEPLR